MKKWQRPGTIARELGVAMSQVLELISDGRFETSRDSDGFLWCAPTEAPSGIAAPESDAVLKLAELHADDLKRLHGELKSAEIGRAVAETEADSLRRSKEEVQEQLDTIRRLHEDLLIRMDFERNRASVLERATTRPWYQFTERAADLRQANAMRLALPAE